MGTWKFWCFEHCPTQKPLFDRCVANQFQQIQVAQMNVRIWLQSGYYWWQFLWISRVSHWRYNQQPHIPARICFCCRKKINKTLIKQIDLLNYKNWTLNTCWFHSTCLPEIVCNINKMKNIQNNEINNFFNYFGCI